LARWQDGIVDGALARLKGETTMAWADPQGSVEAHGRYLDSVGQAKAEGWRGRQSGTMTMRPPRFV
jgi:hypothetical protein